ncbi:hypothetical protein A1O3_08185 [Capronia epimyces CBS 606.96]|uniref:Filamentation protein n=1 Tax=Capronia epimyces CBS 606.96 TaxID=1182542 RepID=W9XRF3_9EURO|nr:uncharacterized protein A1O3_08185 [Capronia epimyces CBS 606.96]EXJ79900.1 hypothetical protein A1O3_08185 [Capronia epimyces CBS 606.96]
MLLANQGQVHHDKDKAQRYIGLLDTARVAGNWQDLPELIRKIRKHAPDRKCLVEVASFELEIANYASRRPGTANRSSTLPDSRVSALETQLRANGQSFEEVVQGHTSLLWARWLGLLQTDKSILPPDLNPSRTAADATSIWTKICVVKSVYMGGMLLGQAGDEKNGGDLHSTLLPWLDSNRSLIISTPQLLYWAQQLLARVALGFHQPHESGAPTASSDESLPFRLQAYRHWAVLAVRNQDISPSTYGNGPGHLSKLAVWRSYYRFLSAILQQGPKSLQVASITRPDLATELRRAETTCENELLRHTQFPRAHESNTVIEEWVEEAIHNWHVLCGPDWSDSDLGEGGRNSVGRNVLDMLYRAATKTFHSTLILRRLFQVHKALADFDLAYKALDTYIELMDRARAREAKSEGPSSDRDSHEVFLRTIAEGIEGLCAFGRRPEAEKAYELCLKLEDLMAELGSASSDLIPNGSEAPNGALQTNGSGPHPLSGALIELTYRAIGIAKSQWARWTPFSEHRSALQSEALQCLHKAVAQTLPPHQQLESLYALSRLLAETRDIDRAIAVVKKVLTSELAEDTAAHSFRIPRQLLPFWHLLALLLTSRQDFENASQSCVAALAQFSPADVMFGTLASGGEKTSIAGQKPGLVDDMECEELQRILEIRITELALTELIEGPDSAVNRSNELLALYSRLFGRFGGLAGTEETSRTRNVEPPKSSAGTVKSVRGSLFSRRRIGREIEKGPKAKEAPSVVEEKTRPNSLPSHAPAIQVTNEDEKRLPHKHKIFPLSHEHEHEHSREEKPRRRLSRSRSRGRKDTSHRDSTRQSFEASRETTSNSRPGGETAQVLPEVQSLSSQNVPVVPVSANHDYSQEAKQPLKEIHHNLASHNELPRPARHESQPPQQDVRLPLAGSHTTQTDAVARFPAATSQRFALTVLVKIWLIIATLYRRASIFDDSREACDEAAKIAMKIEGMVASVESSARAFGDAGWGGNGKSSDEIWADVYYERAELSMAIARAREEKEGQGYSEAVREAADQYEQCLMYLADHAGGIVGLSNVLLDYYERKVELATRIDGGKGQVDEGLEERSRRHKRELSRNSEGPAVNGMTDADGPPGPATGPTAAPGSAATHSGGTKDDELKKTPDNLNRLAARDRAYGLLSALTKQGSGWDNSEAWFALARAHELGGEIDRAKEILWWCVELEDTRPIRHWTNVGCSGYVL